MTKTRTPSDPRVGEIQALAEGLTDLCPEHLRQSIRHVQRNCDIDCNTHEDETSWDDCKQPERGDGERMAAALAGIPYLLAELRKAQDALGRVEVECASSPDHILAQRIRAAVAAATGGERG